MSFLFNIILNLILLLFPLLIYFLLKIYILNNENKDKYFFMGISIFSIILLLVYSNINFFELSIIIFIPLLFNYIKENKTFSIIISILMIFLYKYLFDINIYFLILEYLIYYLTYIFMSKKKIIMTKFINNFIIIRSFFLSFYVFLMYPNIDFNLSILYIFLSILISYLLSFIYYYLLENKISIQDIKTLKKNIDNQDSMHNYLCAVTHELKNSLSISKGYLEILNNNTNKKKKDNYLRIIKKEINRSIDMIQDGLNLSKDKINYEILDINVLLEDVSDTIEELFKNKKIKYRVNYIDDDIYVLGDYEKLKQVLINVLKNSVESKENNLKIEIDNHISRDEVCISIKDNGIGIKDLEYIGKGYTSKYNGMGIGSTFSKNIINKHNGKIIYESVKNEGTTVNILLPIFK